MPATFPPPGGRKRALRWTAFGATALVVATLATAGVVIAEKLSGGGRQPESLVPASAFAFTKVDLDPAAGQKIAILRLDLPRTRGAASPDLYAQYVAASLPPCTDYAHDIKPWLGRRAGIAGVPSPSGAGPVLVAVLQVRNATVATAGLGRVVACSGGQVGFVISHGYAVISTSSAIAVALVASASRGASLGAQPGFRADQRALGGDQIAIGWVDRDRITEVATRVLAAGPHVLIGGPVLSELERLGLRALARLPHGRLLVGLHATHHAFEISGTTIGAALNPVPLNSVPLNSVPLNSVPLNSVPLTSVPGDAAAAIRAVPRGSLAAFAVAGRPGRGAVAALTAQLQVLLGPARSLLGLLLGQRLSVTASETTLVAGLSPLGDRAGSLGEDPLLGAALGESHRVGGAAPVADAVAAGFLRLGPLLGLVGLGNGQTLSSFTAAGLVLTRHGGEVSFRLRLVVRG